LVPVDIPASPSAPKHRRSTERGQLAARGLRVHQRWHHALGGSRQLLLRSDFGGGHGRCTDDGVQRLHRTARARDLRHLRRHGLHDRVSKHLLDDVRRWVAHAHEPPDGCCCRPRALWAEH